MSEPDENLPLSASDSQSTEVRMRRALGLQGASRQAPQRRADARPRHRFVQDGGVPVVLVNSRGESDPAAPFRAQIAELEAALEAERTAHGATRRALHDAQASAQALQTRLAHAELAHGEALATERRARMEAEDSLQARLAPSPRIKGSSAMAEGAPAGAGPKLVKRNASRPSRAVKTAEPKPVKWWLPSYQKKLR